MLRFLWISPALFIMSCSSAGSREPQHRSAVEIRDTVTADTNASSSLSERIRDGKIGREEAKKLLRTLMPLLETYYRSKGGLVYTKADWTFPLRGYDSKTIGGKNGSGYVDAGYSYFDGNLHKGHPALDIFVNDLDQDCIDDKTKKPVDVLSVSGGIVVSTEIKWNPKSEQRGGNYIWIYDPNAKSLFYYAHNCEVLVKKGDLVKPGDVIGHVGRTGLNAYKKRSPTHLHFMQLIFDKEYLPKPVNPFWDLQKMKLVK
jgi:murein DD-endopeptidase MepM/ murein hydrolase activator NlpD